MTVEEIITPPNQGPINQPVEGGPPVPGAWYFEIGSEDGSPTCEFHEDFSSFRAALSMNSRNITESVEVPSSEHVAEIVGRQGCKIKVLRAKTNTYIKTPVRGEDPIFVVTGRPEDVAEAKREIECAAEHFTQIRASRRHSQGGAPAPGHITAYVRVPLRVVGLVVGPKGATIKRIQQDTHTYIITPSREREPIFEVTGLPQNVDAARREIEQHIYQRTGNMPITDTNASLDSYDLQGSLASGATHRTSNISYGALAQPVRRPSTIDVLQNNYDLLKNSPEVTFNLMRNGAFSTYSNGISPPPSQSSNSSNASPHMLYNSLDLCTVGALNAQALLQQQQLQRREKQTTNLLPMSSTDTSLNSSTATSATGNCGYPPWSSVYTSSVSSYGVNNNNETQNQYYQSVAQAFHNQDPPQSRAPFVPLFSNFGQACGGAALQDVTSLHVEDLSDSLKMRADQIDFDPYHLMKSIWSDLDNEKTAGSVDSAAAVATA